MVAFTGYPLDHFAVHALDRAFPSRLTTFNDGRVVLLHTDATHYVYVYEGAAHLMFDGRSFTLTAGYYASVPGCLDIAGDGKGIIVTREGYTGFFSLGGPVEQEGRLKYIDGCTDSLLISPPMKGDPCLNLLYFPPGIDQTAHIHPSDRIGIVMSGRGRCIHGDDDAAVDLVPGMAFCIHTNGKHKFQTPYGEHMRVLAYHPDSDHGPSDEEHPMINRTIVDGVPARYLDEIRTK